MEMLRAARQIPHSMKQVVNKKLDKMRKQGTIERVEGGTPWLLPRRNAKMFVLLMI